MFFFLKWILLADGVVRLCARMWAVWASWLGNDGVIVLPNKAFAGGSITGCALRILKILWFFLQAKQIAALLLGFTALKLVCCLVHLFKDTKRPSWFIGFGFFCKRHSDQELGCWSAWICSHSNSQEGIFFFLLWLEDLKNQCVWYFPRTWITPISWENGGNYGVKNAVINDIKDFSPTNRQITRSIQWGRQLFFFWVKRISRPSHKLSRVWFRWLLSFG